MSVNLISPFDELINCWNQLVFVRQLLGLFSNDVCSESLNSIIFKLRKFWGISNKRNFVKNFPLFFNTYLRIRFHFILLLDYKSFSTLSVSDSYRIFDKTKEYKSDAHNHPYVHSYHIRNIDFRALVLLSYER